MLHADVTAALREESGPVGLSTGEVTMSQIKSSSVKSGYVHIRMEHNVTSAFGATILIVRV